VVQDNVVHEIMSRNLAVYVVWEPILRPDDERSSRKATTFFPDERVKNYWANTQEVGKLFQAPIDLRSEPAWDVYLVYPPGVAWNGAIPPKPRFFMHQLGGRLPDDLLLDGERLASELRGILSE
jgi:hypothetical protein